MVLESGTRGLSAIVEEMRGDCMYVFPSHPEIGRVHIKADVVRGLAKPTYDAGAGTLTSTLKSPKKARSKCA